MSKDPPPISVKDAVYKIQLSLLEGILNENHLFAAGSLISRSDYEDVVIERSISNLCGYPLCANSLPLDPPSRKGRYRIALKEHKVYDLKESRMYCSSNCVVSSKAFAASLKDERCEVSDSGKIYEVLRFFGELDLEEKGKKDELRFSDLKIEEKTDTKAGEVSLEDWIGPSNAIEGFVPLRDRDELPLHSEIREKGSKPKETGLVKREEGAVRNEADFMSTILIGDQLSPPETLLGLQKKDSKPKPNVNKKLQGKVSVEKAAKPNETKLKSALKSSGVKTLSCSVTWADKKRVESADVGNLCNGQEMENKSESIGSSSVLEVDDGNSSLRLASAEACAIALSQEAVAVASGEADVGYAEAGIVILPCPVEGDEENCLEIGDEGISNEFADMSKPDHHHSVKWPRKPVFLDTDIFDSEDSWHDTPPEGFSLTLSPYATMWMALFGWVSASSLAYIYGRDESFQDEFLFVNGRDYPRKIVLRDGRSSEIKQTLDGCIARSLPNVVADFRLPTPISILEQFLGRLLDTMSYVDPLPPFRTKQWNVIVLLFIDALSVCRIPALTPHMASRRMLLQKVLDTAQVSEEEYKVMNDLLIPLGR